ncbi:MAG: polyketide synthase, partial [Planctomycetes bacterium]|nr:polyketide synthase [Planctomycetota bacterium]
TACSSSLVAIHRAVEALRFENCEMALAGGVNLFAHSYHGSLLSGFELLSKDNKCRPFGSGANGWVAGEGAGVVLIKPIEDALRDGDYIHGIIKGTAIGHSGRTMRFGAPSSTMQAESIKKAIAGAEVSRESISYIEAAVPGASIADASEVNAIKEVFQGQGDALSSRYIGTVKSNIGHLESASAMSQITKVLLQMKHRQIAPTINCKPVNPMIQLQGSGLEIADRLKPWSGQSKEHVPFRALINAFGASGSMGHIILEQYVGRENKRGDKAKPAIILLSAATKEQLTQQVSKLYDFLAQEQTFHIPDIGYTLRMGRVEMEERL